MPGSPGTAHPHLPPVSESGHNAPPIPDADRSAIAAVQRDIIAAMRAGRQLSHAHKEGGTRIGWDRDRFVIEDYGEWSSRREFADESSFLEGLWKRYDWMVSPGRGAQRRSEIEAWRFILHELRRDPFSGPNTATTTWSRLRRMRMFAALLVLILAVVGFGVARLLQVRTIGAPFGSSVRLGDTLATLVRTQERYIPSLHRNPDRDRFRIDLLLTPLTGDAKARVVPLARDLQHNAFHPGTKLLGTDGPLLWMMVPELKALDVRSSRLIALKDLRAANPALEEIWFSARFHFTDRMHLMSADRQRSYTIEPETLRARIEDAPPRVTWQDPAPPTTAQQCLGGLIDEVNGLVALSPAERSGSFRIGSMLARDFQIERSREPRTLHRMRAEPLGSRLRLVELTELSSTTYTGGTFIRSAPGAGPLALENPASVLVCHQSGPTLDPKILVTRVDLQGSPRWSTDTGLRELDQILPGGRLLVVIGRLPALDGRVPEPVVVTIDTATGRPSTRSLRL